ncbi:hypothetical protein OHB37_20445 [Streptomyces albidoflavus]|uniref:hypothetical protein n=1 Tax=Streptomyces TaxID=1883 RepID=UPI001BE67038|nr:MULTISPECIES: hypothetical protein [unclassified Streptomyces]MBT2880927.1 hypothetical protein [Streptomyces sp. McG6]MBT2886623.1 hypothetical protein [Streptomyces sp. McG5]MBT2893048.1 hypothetical protein [Streptomyces sp. McG2]WSB16386.1 hypothetical protein OHB37_20445 [Streptomyces albidoflavus]
MTAVWQPEEGETLLHRSRVSFATGEAMRVRGMRWFRDMQGRDVQGDLRGWPDGPSYEVRTLRAAFGRQAPRVALMALGVAVMVVLSAAGGNVSGGSGGGQDKPDDRAEEVEDYPVMRAAPETVARSLPWQLDPGRSNLKRYKTHLVVTDRRMLILGLPYREKNRGSVKDEVLWEAPRDVVDRVEPKDFKSGWDVKVHFRDGSWVRWTVADRLRLLRYLDPSRALVAPGSLSPAHRRGVQEFMADQPADAGPPIITRSTCGCLQVSVCSPTEVDGFFGSRTSDFLMNAQGEEQETPHPDDYEE